MLVHRLTLCCNLSPLLSLPCCLFTFFLIINVSFLCSPSLTLHLFVWKKQKEWPEMACFHLLPPSFHLFLLRMHKDIIKSWSSFNIHLHNRTSTLSVAALRGRGRVIGSDYLPEDDAGLGRHLQLFIHNASTETQMHFIVSFCILFYP